MEVDVEIVAAAACVLAEKAFLVSFLNRTLEHSTFVVEFAADVDVCRSTLRVVSVLAVMRY